MEWFRVYHNISTDPKLHRASRLAKVPRCMALGAWVAVLDHASQQSDRGSLDGLDGDTLAYLAGLRPATAAALLGAFASLGMIVEGRVAAWSARQKSSDNVSARTKAFRERAAKSLPPAETPPNGNVPDPFKNRVEKNSKNTPPSLRSGTPPGGPRPDPRGCRLPADFQPDLEEAERLGLSPSRAAGEVERFRDHWRAQPGAKGRKADWPAAWRNWCRKAAELSPIERAAKGAEVDILAEARRYSAERRARREAAEREASDALH